MASELRLYRHQPPNPASGAGSGPVVETPASRNQALLDQATPSGQTKVGTDGSGRPVALTDAQGNPVDPATATPMAKVGETPTPKYQKTPGDLYAGPTGQSLRDSIHGQVGNSHYSTVDDPTDPDPIQGRDVDVWVERYIDPTQHPYDPRTPIKSLILLGSFQELSLRVASKSLRYYEVDSRNPILLDDEWTIFFTLGKGLIDMEILEQTFGLRHIHQLARFNRLPRLKITFNSDTRSLDPQGRPRGELNQSVRIHGWSDADRFARMAPTSGQSQADRAREALIAATNSSSLNRPVQLAQQSDSPDRAHTDEVGASVSQGSRYPLGRWVLEGARCNELLLHAAGIKVVQNQWQGEAEALRALVFEEPDGSEIVTDGKYRRFRPFYRHGAREGLSEDQVRHRHLDADLGPAAMTNDPEIEAMIKRAKVQGLIEQSIQGYAELGAGLIQAGTDALFGINR